MGHINDREMLTLKSFMFPFRIIQHLDLKVWQYQVLARMQLQNSHMLWWSVSWQKHIGKLCGRVYKAEHRSTL